MKLNDASRISGEISFATWNKTQWYIFTARRTSARGSRQRAHSFDSAARFRASQISANAPLITLFPLNADFSHISKRQQQQQLLHRKFLQNFAAPRSRTQSPEQPTTLRAPYLTAIVSFPLFLFVPRAQHPRAHSPLSHNGLYIIGRASYQRIYVCTHDGPAGPLRISPECTPRESLSGPSLRPDPSICIHIPREICTSRLCGIYSGEILQFGLYIYLQCLPRIIWICRNPRNNVRVRIALLAELYFEERRCNLCIVGAIESLGKKLINSQGLNWNCGVYIRLIDWLNVFLSTCYKHTTYSVKL